MPTFNSYNLANPTLFMAISKAALPWLSVASIVVLALGIYMSFFISPADYQQGETVRIMFVHVPAAWLSMGCYTAMTLSAIGTLVWKHPLADIAQKATAPIGAAFTLVALITGSIWGKPMWGAWWVWDARLTSVLLLFLIYLGLVALWQSLEDHHKAARAVSIMTLVGALNIPIIKFSVDWWNTLHQPASVFRMSGPTLHPAILQPLLVMATGAALLAAVMILLNMRNHVMERRLNRRQTGINHNQQEA